MRAASWLGFAAGLALIAATLSSVLTTMRSPDDAWTHFRVVRQRRAGRPRARPASRRSPRPLVGTMRPSRGLDDAAGAAATS